MKKTEKTQKSTTWAFLMGQVKREYLPSKVYLFMRQDGLNTIMELLNKFSIQNIRRLSKLNKTEEQELIAKIYDYGAQKYIRHTDETNFVEEKKYTMDRVLITDLIYCAKTYYCHWWLCERQEKFFRSICEKLERGGFIIGYEKKSTELYRITFCLRIVGTYGFNQNHSQLLFEVLFELNEEGYYYF